MQLSKTEFMMFLKHPAWLWLKKHDKAKLPEIDDALQSIFDDGHLFEEYADKLFPDAEMIGFEKDNYASYLAMVNKTKQAIQSGVKTILQGRLESGKTTCIFDVIVRVEGNIFDLYEIKSSTEVKDEHLKDLSFQTLVLEGTGLTIRKIFVIHVNNEYVRNGEINVKEFVKQTEVTDDVREIMGDTVLSIEKAILVMESKIPPDFSPRHVGLGALDEWMAIYEILHPQSNPHNIFNLTYLNPKLIGQFEDMGISLIKDIPDSVKLNAKQQRQVKATKEDKRIINKENIKKFFSNIQYPLYFLDYETFNVVVPPFDGLHPYQQVPFQYSLHILDRPNGYIQHKEYLHKENTNPSLSLLKSLKKDIGDTGTIYVWYDSFEKGRNKELGEMHSEYFDFMREVDERIVDLMTPFYEGWFIDKDFFGSASIKKVLPVLVTELSYEKLGIKKGDEASRLWTETVLENKNQEKKEKIMNNLIEYCKTDTLAMVQLFRFLQKEVNLI